MLIDSHAHLFWKEFRSDIDKVIQQAKLAKVEKIVVPGLDVKTSQEAIELSKHFAKTLKAGIGLHPEVSLIDDLDLNKEIKQLKLLLEKDKKQIVAIGEVGLDKHTAELKSRYSRQEIIFKEMVSLAKKYQLPLIIHSRDKVVKTILKIVDEIGWKQGVFHCFSGDEQELELIIKNGFYVSFCGNITWSKRVARLVKLVPNNKLLIETDSPFMSPRNNQGKLIAKLRNEPRNVRILAKYYSQLRKTRIEIIEKLIEKNTKALFKL